MLLRFDYYLSLVIIRAVPPYPSSHYGADDFFGVLFKAGLFKFDFSALSVFQKSSEWRNVSGQHRLLNLILFEY